MEYMWKKLENTLKTYELDPPSPQKIPGFLFSCASLSRQYLKNTEQNLICISKMIY